MRIMVGDDRELRVSFTRERWVPTLSPRRMCFSRIHVRAPSWQQATLGVSTHGQRSTESLHTRSPVLDAFEPTTEDQGRSLLNPQTVP